MIKSVLLLQRRYDITFDTFRRYYEDVHVPLATAILKPSTYVRNYRRPGAVQAPYIEANFDCITELTFRAAPVISTEDLERLRTDEARFIDVETLRVLQVDV